jgi:predicted nucleic acid-binding protein
VADLATWQVVIPTVDDVLAAIDGTARWQISCWDAMVMVAASRADATVLWSEDLSDGQTYDGIVVRNPFRDVT